MSKKRSLECESNTNEPLLKRQKVGSNDHQKASLLFAHQLDNEQYQQIFNAIDNSQIIKSLHITHSISRNIAEFANGQFKQCANDKCNNDIPTLHRDSIIYDNNHENSVKIGYKWCLSNKLFCSDCMDLVTPCNCYICEDHERQYLIFDLKECDSCMLEISMASHEDCCDRAQRVCEGCGGTYCGLWQCNIKMLQCITCSGLFCDKCYIIPKGWDGEEYCVCHGCKYDGNETEIECKKCNVKYPLVFKPFHDPTYVNNKWHRNHYLWNTDLDCRMMKCTDKNCDIFICLNCDKKERNGKLYSCKKFGCCHFDKKFGCCHFDAYFCHQHAPKEAFCLSALRRKKQQ